MTAPGRLLSTAPLLVGGLLVAGLLGLALALEGLQRQGVLSSGRSMVLSAFPVLQRSGVLFSTHRDRPSRRCSLGFWYLQHSKKVWFRLPSTHRTHALQLVFSYRGQPILHVSERHSLERVPAYGRRAPVLWGDYVGHGWGSGPEGTTLFLQLWTRWTWLHPEACGHPEQFRVDLYEPPPGPSSSSMFPPPASGS